MHMFLECSLHQDMVLPVDIQCSPEKGPEFLRQPVEVMDRPPLMNVVNGLICLFSLL